MSRLYTSLIVIPILVVVAWGGVQFLMESRPKTERLPPRDAGLVPVLVRSLEPESVTVEVSAFGTLVAGREAQLASEIPGRVARRLEPWTVGRFVEKGTLLVELDVALHDQEVNAAEAHVAEASATVEATKVESSYAEVLLPLARESFELAKQEEVRLQGLSEGSYASDSQIDKASRARAAAATSLRNAEARQDQAGASEERSQQSLQAALATLGVARERRKLAELRAPFDGYLTQPGPVVGTYLAIGVPVASVVDTGDLRVVLEIPEEQFAGIDIGQAALVGLPARPGESFEGRVIGIGVKAHSQLRSLPVEVALVSGVGMPEKGHLGSSRLRPGQFVQVSISTSLVPAGLVLRREEFTWRTGQPTAFVQVESGEGMLVEARALTLGARIEQGFLIEAGLSAGETLITRPLGRLNGGELCRLRDEQGD